MGAGGGGLVRVRTIKFVQEMNRKLKKKKKKKKEEKTSVTPLYTRAHLSVRLIEESA